jgi:hypothetical protein
MMTLRMAVRMAAGHDGGAAAAPLRFGQPIGTIAPRSLVAIMRRPMLPDLRTNVGVPGVRHYLWADKRTRATA